MDNRTQLKILLGRKGYTQKQFALECNCTEATVSRIASGHRRPRITLLKRMAEVLNITTDDLIKELEL